MKKAIVVILVGMLLTSFSRSYPSKVISVYDGDTITIEIDLGLDITKTEKIRMYGINAPEMRGSEKAQGTKSRDALRTLILGKEVRLVTLKGDKKGKYGRLIGTIYIGELNVNEWMVENGYAKHKKY